MVTSLHTMIYSDDPDATRAFLRDVLQWPFVEAHPGWLIFRSGLSEMGVHPTRSEWEGKIHEAPRHHSLSLMCDDITATMAELGSRGAEFRGGGRGPWLRFGRDDGDAGSRRHPVVSAAPPFGVQLVTFPQPRKVTSFWSVMVPGFQNNSPNTCWQIPTND